jgi:glycosyltransferase involved in cell wall biosynthesis
MQRKPKLSICIPTYNQVQFVAAAVESALAQRFDDFEVVVSDNHCTDGTSELIGTMRDPRLRIVSPPEHVTVTENFNFCASQTEGEYLTFLSSDDILLPDFSARLSLLLDKSPHCSFVYCAAELIDGVGQRIGFERHVGGNRQWTSREALKRFMRGSRCVFDAMMIRRICYERCGGLGILRNGKYLLELPDWDLDLRLAMMGDVAYLDEILVQFRFWSAPNREQNSRRLPRYIEELGRMLDTTGNEIVAAYPDLASTLKRARRAMAVNCALGVGELSGLVSYEDSVRNVRKLHDSLLVRAILLSHSLGLTPIVVLTRKLQSRLRQQVKDLLYQS